MAQCIYHDACVDGLASAAIVKLALGDDVCFSAGKYGSSPPVIEADELYIVDFSYPKSELLELLAKVNKLTVLDHHKTAQQELSGISDPRARIVFDMERSGAGLTWDHFNPGVPRPKIVDLIEDRDLWRFALDGSKEAHHVLATLPHEVSEWSQIFGWDVFDVIAKGKAIDIAFMAQIAQLLPLAFQATIGGQSVPVCNAPFFFASELAGQLAKDAPFAGVFSYNQEHEFWSLRSRGGAGADVSEVAKLYGGGGHRNAAGFRVARGTFF